MDLREGDAVEPIVLMSNIDEVEQGLVAAGQCKERRGRHLSAEPGP